jgi:predicted RNase H-like HicB family nuclease
MKTVALIEKGKNGTYGIYTPDLKSTIIGEGISVAEAKKDFENSVQEIIEVYAEDGQELPEELKNLTFEYKYDLASLFDYYRIINVSQFAKTAGINPSLMRQYKSGQYISEKQISKIEKELNRIGRELANLSLI